MSDFKIAFLRTGNNEGGWKSADDKTDSGGETYRGVSRNNFPQWAGWKYIDGCKAQMTTQPTYGTSAYYEWVKYLNRNLELITALQSLVEAFYRDNFWKRIGEIEDQHIANAVYDLDVNSGSMGSKTIQLAAGVTADGVIGAKSISAINNLDPVQLLIKFNTLAKEFYDSIIEKHPEKAKYRHSWMSRLKDYNDAPFVA